MSELIDNRARRVPTLKEILQHLHKGEAPAAVKGQLREIVRQTHPIDTFRRENTAIRRVIAKIRTTLAELSALEDSRECKSELLQLHLSANELMAIDKHYQRKEHVLFSSLERHGITGPSKVMWAKDDDIRAALKRMNQAARDCRATAAEGRKLSAACVLPALAAVVEMIFKEENILLPVSLETLTENEWAEIWASSPKYGWCLVEPQDGYTPPKSSDRRSQPYRATARSTCPPGMSRLSN